MIKPQFLDGLLRSRSFSLAVWCLLLAPVVAIPFYGWLPLFWEVIGLLIVGFLVSPRRRYRTPDPQVAKDGWHDKSRGQYDRR